MKKRVLVIGAGAREHALGWKLAQSPDVEQIYVSPGNDGMPAEWKRLNAPDFAALAKLAIREEITLTVVGPDNALADGVVDLFTKEGLLCFGPTQAAAQIESSKSFAKEVMTAAQVPTAQSMVASDERSALSILDAPLFRNGWVVKADGLALGKGVRICDTRQEAVDAVRDLIQVNGKLVIEEKLKGAEISWMALCDGDRCALLEPARDYKRLLDHQQGPNTGGMGAFSPVPGIPRNFAEKIRKEVFMPTLRELAQRGTPFRGVLYAGLMVSERFEKYWVIEFNSRFGDPEAQVLMPRISGDLYPWLEACAKGQLQALPDLVPFIEDQAIYVVAASEGYPVSPRKGDSIEGCTEPGFFFAGVKQEKGSLKTSGGRVLGALGLGATLAQARDRAYAKIRRVKFRGIQFRNDIGMSDS